MFFGYEIFSINSFLFTTSVTFWADGPSEIEEDNKGAADTARGDGSPEALRHLDHTEFFCRDLQEKGIIRVKKVPTEENASDLLNKPAESRAKMVRLLGKHGFRLPPYQRKPQIHPKDRPQ